MAEWALENSSARGVYNVTAPEPVRNREFASALGEVLKRPSFLPTPRFALVAALGEMAEALLFASQRVMPAHADEENYQFRYPHLRQSLEHALER